MNTQPHETAPNLFAAFSAAVLRHASQVAVLSAEQRWTYATLAARAHRWAHLLGPLGAALEGPLMVGFLLAPSPERVAVTLGIVGAGAAMVPLDPAAPALRLRHQLSHTGAKVLITDRAHAAAAAAALPAEGVSLWVCEDLEAALAAQPEVSPSPNLDRGSLLYVMYSSGSTGRPKGVAIPHAGVLSLCLSAELAPVAAGDRVAHIANVAFDASTWELWAPLLNGGAVALIPPEVALSTPALGAALAALGVTHLFLTTALFDLHARTDPRIFGGVRWLLFGGEAANPTRVGEVFAACPQTALHNVYGPTECTTFATGHRLVGPPTGAVPIGRPFAGRRCLVVDEALQPVPRGARGELLIGGEGLALGYLGDQGNTAARFITVAGAPPQRVYRTGDIVVEGEDGALTFLGRVDNQVKIRGFRIEPEEVEVTLARHPAVSAAVVRTPPDPSGHGLRLEALLVCRAPVDAAALRAHLELSLPPYMVPAVFLQVDELPLGPTGKVSRGQLGALCGRPLEVAAPREAPLGPLEEALAARWEALLGLAPASVGRHDDFFALGGQSLLAAELVGALAREHACALRARDLFEAPTVARLAARLAQELTTGAAQGLLVAPDDQDLPLTPGQEQIWLHQAVAPQAVHYNEVLDLELPEVLDLSRFSAAFDDLLERHEGLRCRVVSVDGAPRQRVYPLTPGTLEQVDLRHLPRGDRDAAADALAGDRARQPFDLGAEQLVRGLLVRLADDHARHYFIAHHIVMDGVSMYRVVFPELERLYRGAALGPASPRFRDLAWTLHQRAATLDRRALEAWWTGRLAGLPPLRLPVDHPAGTEPAGATLVFRWPPALSAGLRALARRAQTTLNNVLRAAVHVWLLQLTGARDQAVVGVRSARDLPGSDDVVGNLLHTVLLRAQLDPDAPFVTVLRALHQSAIADFDHDALPFERVTRIVGGGAGGEATAVAIVLEPPATGGGWRHSQHRVHTGTAKFPLAIEVEDQPDALTGRIEYRSDQLDRRTVAAWLAQLEQVLSAAVAAPDAPIRALCARPEAERSRVLAWGRGPGLELAPGGTLHGAVEAQAARAPAAPAVRCAAGDLSFAELDQRANGLAAALLDAAPLTQQARVAVWCDRGPDHLVAQLAVLKAGCAYVPVAANSPAAHLRLLIEDAGAVAVLCDDPARLAAAAAVGVPAVPTWGCRASVVRPARDVRPNDLAYVIYTSGTTGRPKGVPITHADVLARVGAVGPAWGLRQGACSLHLFGLAFDGALLPTWFGLAAGAAVALLPAAELTDPQAVAAAVRRFRVTHVHATPSLLSLLADALPWVDCVLSGGEALSSALAARLRGVCRLLVNAYGPTEATVLATAADVSAPGAGAPAVGAPLPGCSVYVLDTDGGLALQGAVGEVAIGGLGLSGGYLGRPEETAARFVPDPFAAAPGARMYRTGDRARWGADGQLRLLGREDGQVKIHGHRLELEEVRHALCALSGVRDAALRWDAPAGLLSAYVVLDPGLALDAARAALTARVPRYMVPGRWAALTELPRTANGKVDSAALARMDAAEGVIDAPAAGDGPLPWLVGLFAELLGAPVGPADDFFDRGGDSILGLTLVARARQRGLPLGLRELLEARTPAALAARLSAAAPAAPPPPAPAAPSAAPPAAARTAAEAGLLPIHRWFLSGPAEDQDHFLQAFVLRCRAPLPADAVCAGLTAVVEHHAGLRMRMDHPGHGAHTLAVGHPDAAPLFGVLDATGLDELDLQDAVLAAAAPLASALRLAAGPAVAALYVDRGALPPLVWAAAHHLVVDGVSWRVLLEDWGAASAAVAAGQAPALPPAGAPIGAWARALQAHADGPARAHLGLWQRQLAAPPICALPGGAAAAPGRVGEQRVLRHTLSPAQTRSLLVDASGRTGAPAHALWLTAVHGAIAAWLGQTDLTLWCEGHGREDLDPSLDLSRAVGWFTSLYPVRLRADPALPAGARLGATRRALAQLPHHGLDFLALQQLASDPAVRAALQPAGVPLVLTNYLGRFSEVGAFSLTDRPAGPLHGPSRPRSAVLEVNAWVVDDQLTVEWIGPAALEGALPTLAAALAVELCALGAAPAPALGPPTDPLLPLRRGDGPPLYLAHPAGGLSLVYQGLAAHLPPGLPVVGISDPWFGQADRPSLSLAALAAVYVEAVLGAQPVGPYRLGGWSFGARLALQMAVQLEALGEEVDLLVIIDDPEVEADPQRTLEQHLAAATTSFSAAYGLAPGQEHARWFAEALRSTHGMAFRAGPVPWRGPVVLVRSGDTLEAQRAAGAPLSEWLRAAPLDPAAAVELRVLPGAHEDLLHGEHAEQAAALLAGLWRRCAAAWPPDPVRGAQANAAMAAALAVGGLPLAMQLQDLLVPPPGRPASSSAPSAGPLPMAAAAAAERAPAAPTSVDEAVDDVLEVVLDEWAAVCPRGAATAHTPLLHSGGGSLELIELLARLELRLGHRLPFSAVLQGATPATLAAALRAAGPRSPLVVLASGAPGDRQTPLALVHPAGGSAAAYRSLAGTMGGRRVWGLDATAPYAGRTLAQLAAEYVEALTAAQPRGPYLLGGWSLGGLIAAEMARQLEARGDVVEAVLLLDARPLAHAGQRRYLAHMADDVPLLSLMLRHLGLVAGQPIPLAPAALAALPPDQRRAAALEALRAHGGFGEASLRTFVGRFIDDFRACDGLFTAAGGEARLSAPLWLARAAQVSAPYAGFPALEEPLAPGCDPTYGWGALSAGGCAVDLFESTHEEIVFGELGRAVGAAAARWLARVAPAMPGH